MKISPITIYHLWAILDHHQAPQRPRCPCCPSLQVAVNDGDDLLESTPCGASAVLIRQAAEGIVRTTRRRCPQTVPWRRGGRLAMGAVGAMGSHGEFTTKNGRFQMGMDQYLLIPFLVG